MPRNDDFISRHHGREDPGLVTNGGLHNAVSGRMARLRGRSKSKSRGFEGEAEIRERLLLLEEMLKNQSGIHVRQPSHHAPPYRAQDIFAENFRVFIDQSGIPPLPPLAAVQRFHVLNVDFQGAGYPNSIGQIAPLSQEVTASVMPDGYRGVIQGCSAAAYLSPISISPADPATHTTYTVLKNGVGVPGRIKKPISTSMQYIWPGPNLEVWPYSGGGRQYDATHLSPIHLEPGDQISVEIEFRPPALLGAYTFYISAQAVGWMYPVRQDQPSIRGTIVD